MGTKKYRIFILGAGFSKKAGLPLASGLWRKILKRAKSKQWCSETFRRDLKNYLEFRWRCDRKRLSVGDVDFEDFMEVLDIEHYLRLRGSDTWSDDGTESTRIFAAPAGRVRSAGGLRIS
jgi:NAD-dependent SIR2 family protein deacetylase